MTNIGGNITGLLQGKNSFEKNSIGEKIPKWETINELWGFLDYMSQTTNRNNFKTKLEESTHVFICDYQKLDKKAENKRMIVDDEVYDVLLIDDPMNLHEHLEIYLKYVGGQ